MHDELGNERHIAECPPRAGVEDLVIVPLVVIALAISKLLKAVFSILIYVLDYAFAVEHMQVDAVNDGVGMFEAAAAATPPACTSSIPRGATPVNHVIPAGFLKGAKPANLPLMQSTKFEVIE